MIKYSKEKERGEFAIRSDALETPIHGTTKEDINDLLDSGHEVDYDRLTYPEKKTYLQDILNNQYIKRYGNGGSYTIGGQPNVDDMQKN